MKPLKGTIDEIRAERELAWVGDAVLALYARQWVLREKGCMDGETFVRFTSNGFLSTFGNPTSVEARIGKVFHDGGLDAAFTWIDTELLPTFLRQVRRKGH
jgi:hypothetical protein